MDSLGMRPGISHCSFDGCAIILDIDRDRYWQVDSDMGTALDWIAGRRTGPVDPRHFARLERLGLVDQHVHEARPPHHVMLPTPLTSAIEGDADPGGFHLPDAVEVAILAMTARRAIRRHSLRSIIADVESSRRGVRSGSHSPAVIAQRYDRCRRLVPLAKQCLPDTLAFLRFAGRRGCFPALVFGVEAWPFAAHCWAQSGTVVLNDALDHARAYSPILAI